MRGANDKTYQLDMFQSLFSWNLLLMFQIVISQHTMHLFQSLFSWNLLLMCGPVFCGIAYNNVSILVFVELALDDAFTITLSPIQVFQSLFSWNLLLMAKEFYDFLKTNYVSILVFVELALDAPHPQKRKIYRYVSILVFVELALDVWDLGSGKVQVALFQSLFSWNLLLMVRSVCIMGSERVFQSLFSWNLLLMLYGIPACYLRDLVSILVFVELALDVYLDMDMTHGINVSILVFVELALDDCPLITVLILKMRFNPCFRGTCS